MTSPVFPDPHPGDFYGNAVCLWNNYLVVGAYRGDVNNIYNRGKVYLYRLNPSATGWEYITSLWGPGNESENMFGTSLYLHNDTLLVGASGDFITRRIGYVHMYVRNGNSWPLVASLTAPDVTVNDGFGASVHYSNGRVIIGAPEASAVNLAQGKVYIFSHNGSEWKCDATLVSLGGKSWDAFGKSVALSAQTAFVSAPHHDVYGGSGDTRYDNGKIYFYNK